MFRHISILNDSYDKFCGTVKRHMNKRLPSKRIPVNSNRTRRYRSDELSALASDHNQSEKIFSSSNLQERSVCKAQFLLDQRALDNAVKDAKRQYWSQQQHALLALNQIFGRQLDLLA